MTAIVRILVAATLCSFLHVASASATLITFSSRALFNAAAPGLPVEDFEEGNSSFLSVSLTRSTTPRIMGFSPLGTFCLGSA